MYIHNLNHLPNYKNMMYIRAARQLHMFSAGGYFDVFGYAKPENSN